MNESGLECDGTVTVGLPLDMAKHVVLHGCIYFSLLFSTALAQCYGPPTVATAIAAQQHALKQSWYRDYLVAAQVLPVNNCANADHVLVMAARNTYNT